MTGCASAAAGPECRRRQWRRSSTSPSVVSTTSTTLATGPAGRCSRRARHAPEDQGSTSLSGRPWSCQIEVDTSGYEAGDPAAEQSRSCRCPAPGSATSLAELAATSSGPRGGDLRRPGRTAHRPRRGRPGRRAHLGRDCRRRRHGRSVLGALAERFESLDDEYQRERAQDVRSVERRVLRSLVGGDADDDAADRLGRIRQVLVTPELDAATAATLDTCRVAGVVTTEGRSHRPRSDRGADRAAYRSSPGCRSRSRSRPGSWSPSMRRRPSSWSSRTPQPRSRYAAMAESRELQRQAALAAAFEPAVTTRRHDDPRACQRGVGGGGRGSGRDGRRRCRAGAYRGACSAPAAPHPPSTSSSTAFLAIGAALGGAPITIRTWDVGGDKPLAYLPQPHEANPFLGERGLRLSRRDPATLA